MAGPTSNVAWGDDGSVLYVTADTALYRIRLGTRGLGFQAEAPERTRAHSTSR